MPMPIVSKVNAAAIFPRRHKMPAAILALVALCVFAAGRADAGSAMRSSGCVGSGFSVSCVTTWQWDEPGRKSSLAAEDPKLAAEAAERERKWVARCKPTIRQDQYGVRRYRYAAPGCEYGKAED